MPFPPGGGTDTGTRLLAAKLAAKWAQPVVVENKPGAAGMVGADHVSKQKPDGYTLLMGNFGTQSINPTLYAKKIGYNPDTAFAAMAEISRHAAPAGGEGGQTAAGTSAPSGSDTGFGRKKLISPAALASVDDGRDSMQRVFVEGRLASATEFAECWTASAATPPERVSDPFVQLLSHRGGLAVDKSLQAICSHCRTPFINLDRYDVDVELAKTFPREVCRRLCVLPMDKMSKAVFVATANPFNKRAEEELRQFTAFRIVWYLAMPNDLHRLIEKIYR